MKIIIWNRFPDYYVISKDPDSFDGLKFHFHGTEEECEQYIHKRKNK